MSLLQVSLYKTIITTTKMTAIATQFPRLDKLCDATFIKRIFGTTKKDAAEFIIEKPEHVSFMTGLEKELESMCVCIKEKITNHFKDITTQQQITVFKRTIKSKNEESKNLQSELDAQAAIDQYKNQMLMRYQAKKNAQLVINLVDNKSTPPLSSSAIDDDNDSDGDDSIYEAMLNDEASMPIDQFFKLVQSSLDDKLIVVIHNNKILDNVSLGFNGNRIEIITVCALPSVNDGKIITRVSRLARKPAVV
jgi:hypothetical protein